MYFFFGLKNKGNFLPRRGRQPPCVCRCLSLTCSRSNSMCLLVASYAKPCALGLGRGEGKCFFVDEFPRQLLTSNPSAALPTYIFCQTKIGKQRQQRSKKDDECERQATTMDSRRRREGRQKRTANDDRRGRQRRMTNKGGK